MHQHQSDFYLKEYESLRDEIELLLTQDQQSEQYTVLAIAAVWTWLTTTEARPDDVQWAWWIPLGIVIAAFVRHMMITRHFSVIATYIRDELEKALEVTGWESYLKRQSPIRYINVAYHSIAWGLLFIVTLAVPCLKVFFK